MALSGFILVGFVVVHMLGNLKIFLGIDAQSGMYAFDLYAKHLREIGEAMLGHEVFLWIARVVLFIAFILHVLSAILLSIENRKAKPIAAHSAVHESATVASRTMTYGGLFLFFFVIYHILHLTTGHVHPGPFIEGKAYSNVVIAFQNPLAVVFYLGAVMFLALHLYHGIWSIFQSLGLTSSGWNNILRMTARLIALALFVGFSSVPVAVYTGKLKTDAVLVQNILHK